MDLWDWCDVRFWLVLVLVLVLDTGAVGARRLIVMDRWRTVGGVIGREVAGLGRNFERWEEVDRIEYWSVSLFANSSLPY